MNTPPNKKSQTNSIFIYFKPLPTPTSHIPLEEHPSTSPCIQPLLLALTGNIEARVHELLYKACHLVFINASILTKMPVSIF